MTSLTAQDVSRELRSRGYTIFTGVPCSLLGGLIELAEARSTYIRATDEGNATAVCAGAYLGGAKSVLMMQNSGLTNALSPISSLLLPYRIPVLGFVTLRGEPGTQDAPQHRVMGEISLRLLELCGVQWEFLSATNEEFSLQLTRAEGELEAGRSFFFVVRKERGLRAIAPRTNALAQARSEAVGALAPGSCFSAPVSKTSPPKLRRATALELIKEAFKGNCALLSTTGYTSRELFALGDEERYFYMTGSMGCLAPLALGLALSQPGLKVIVLDGDGALLMRLGALAMVGRCRPPNLVHIVFNNGCYESTGGQASLAQEVDLQLAAAAAGYQATYRVSDGSSLRNVLRLANRSNTAVFVELRIEPGALVDIPRPNHTLEQLALRFRHFVAEAVRPARLATAQNTNKHLRSTEVYHGL